MCLDEAVDISGVVAGVCTQRVCVLKEYVYSKSVLCEAVDVDSGVAHLLY